VTLTDFGHTGFLAPDPDDFFLIIKFSNIVVLGIPDYYVIPETFRAH
jgi:hypothetical protein